MINQVSQKFLSSLLCLALILAGAPAEPAHAFQAQSSSAPTVAPLTSDELNALVAPIALYPDALVAQVLGAAEIPDQIAIADYWLGQNSNLTGTALAQAVDQQSWDPSVKALTQFPSVLHNLATNLAWTSNLGQAFENQQAEVMAAVQVMRAKAQAAGTLQSTPQIKVVQQSPQTIVIQPANPNVVYVPEYNPTVVYGSPYVVPLYTPPVAVAAATVSFGAGVALGAVIGGGGFVGGGGGGFSWGFSSWNCNWGGGGGGGGNVVFNHNTYIHNTVINNRTNYNNYHPWGPGPNGANGPHPYGPHGNGGPNRFQPNGGHNGNGGLIGGNGGTQHPIGGNTATQRPIGGNTATQHPMGGNDGGQRPFGGNNSQRADGQGSDRFRSPMSGNGQAARTEANRGRATMHPATMNRQRAPQRVQRPQRQQAGGQRGGRR